MRRADASKCWFHHAKPNEKKNLPNIDSQSKPIAKVFTELLEIKVLRNVTPSRLVTIYQSRQL